MNKLVLNSLLCLAITAASCQKPAVKDNTDLINQNGSDSATIEMFTDKAMYSPGDQVIFTIHNKPPAGTQVVYRKLNQVLKREPVQGTTWTWTAPANDFTGYLVTLENHENDREKIYGAIAVDISSDPARFPRNGFLSHYGKMSSAHIRAIIDNLNRLHINWIQFQDWEWKHHRPLAGTPDHPAASWKDIANRTNYLTTVKGYIQAAHAHNIKTLSYNLCYGALDDAASDGVLAEWYLYTDKEHTSRDVFNLPSPPFKSDIYFTNPANTGWQHYLAERNKDLYTVYDFDGYQIDQVGNRNKSLYDYYGNPVDLSSTFNPFIFAMKKAAPEKKLVMNAVNQYGQEGIATAPVDFLYSEVWTPNDSFVDLAQVILDNSRYSNGQKQTVLAAYMDYDLADSKGFFNTPGVLLTDAVIFAFGGAHLELGEHMLGKEYFPNNNLRMYLDLKKAMIRYYDFLVAYENLLRDGGTFNKPVLVSADDKMQLSNWPPELGKVSIIGKEIGTREVMHLVNFSQANSLLWRDADGTQPEPKVIKNASLIFTSEKQVQQIWFASPDVNRGAPKEIEFTQSGNQVTFTLSSLKYWDMIVVEYN